MIMLQQILKIGNSFGVTVPKEFIKKNKLKVGSKVEVDYKVLKSTEYEAVTDKDFLDAVKLVEKNYSKALDDLANL